ncbi:MAG: hypothetical protein JXB39_08220 [Deltaproteobacteria bacterium]|nr:hypothetical protein [Deltaproteobacteria bacterium]
MSPKTARWARLAGWTLALAVLVVLYVVLQPHIVGDRRFNRDRSETFKVWILGFGIGLVALRWAWHRWLEPRASSLTRWSSRALAFLLLALCFTAVANYGRFGTYVIRDRVDVYDLIHYYLNARYFDELGYYDLYPACILADLENGGPWFKSNPPTFQDQDENGYAFRPISEGVQKGLTVKEKFTPERWASFSHEFLVLQRETYGLTLDYWWQLVNDHGFNGSPAWVGYASPIAKLVPVESVKLLGYLDLVLLLGAVGASWWAFGGWSAGFLLLFLVTTYSTRWPTVTWAFLRYDYAVALILGAAFVRKGKGFWAGLSTSHATAMRIFPLLWSFGPAVQGLWQLVRHRRLERFALLFLAGFVVWLLALEANFAIQYGWDAVVSYWTDMATHMEPANLSSRREGLAIALAYRGEFDAGWSEARINRVAFQEPIRMVVAALLLLPLAWGLRRADRAEAYALGFIPFFALTTASYYYYVVRAPLIAVYGSDLRRGRHALALGFLLAVDLFSNFAEQHLGGNRIFVIGWLGWSLLAFCIGTIGVLLWEDAHARPKTAPLPEPS